MYTWLLHYSLPVRACTALLGINVSAIHFTKLIYCDDSNGSFSGNPDTILSRAPL